MIDLDKITDIAAELVVAGCVVASPRGSDLAHQRLTSDAFTRPYLRDLFDAGPDLPTAKPTFDDPLEPGLAEQRVIAAAARTDIHADDVRALVAARPVLDDTAGGYTALVRAAWLRRGAIEAIDDAVRLIGDDDTTAVALLEAALDALTEAA